MNDTKTSARRWFDHRARAYEGGFTARWRDPLQRASLDALELMASDRLLDIACGTGWASRVAAQTGASVVGIDLSPEMIRQAVEKAAGIHGLRFALADAEDMPFEDRAFSAILCTNAFHHYPDPVRAIREMARLLAPGGRLVIGDASADEDDGADRGLLPAALGAGSCSPLQAHRVGWVPPRRRAVERDGEKALGRGPGDRARCGRLDDTRTVVSAWLSPPRAASGRPS